jgi:hypothetical protein
VYVRTSQYEPDSGASETSLDLRLHQREQTRQIESD